MSRPLLPRLPAGTRRPDAAAAVPTAAAAAARMAKSHITL